MPFDTAIQDIKKYRDNHLDALTNKKPNKWFTEDIEDVAKSFDTEQENNEWETEWLAEAGDQVKLISVGARLSWLSSMYRDLRAQFFSAPSGTEGDTSCRNFAEYTRHAAEHIPFYTYVLDKFKKFTKS